MKQKIPNSNINPNITNNTTNGPRILLSIDYIISNDTSIIRDNFLEFMSRLDYYLKSRNIQYNVDPFYLFGKFADNNYINNTFFEENIPLIEPDYTTHGRGLWVGIVIGMGVLALALIGTAFANQSRQVHERNEILGYSPITPFYGKGGIDSSVDLSSTNPDLSISQIPSPAEVMYKRRKNEKWKYIDFPFPSDLNTFLQFKTNHKISFLKIYNPEEDLWARNVIHTADGFVF